MIRPSYLSSLLAALLVLSLPIPASAQPAPATSTNLPDSAQLEAVTQLMTAMKIPAIMRYQMTHAPNIKPEAREIFQHMSTHASDGEISAVMAPVYAPFFSIADAQQAAAFYRSATGVQHVDAMLGKMGVMPAGPAPLFTKQEMAEIRRIDTLPSMRNMAGSQKQLTERMGVALRDWSERYYAVYRTKAMAKIAAIMRDDTPPGDIANLKGPLLEPSGMASLDKLMEIIARTCLQMKLMTANMQHDLDSYGVKGVMEPAQWVSAAGIAQARQVLAKADQRMERYVADAMALVDQYRVQVAEFIPDAQARESLDKEMVPAYSLMVRLAEVQRAIFDVFARTLNFAESRAGRLQVKDGKLVLLDEADRPPLQELLAQLQKAIADAQQVANEGQQMSDRGMAKMIKGK